MLDLSVSDEKKAEIIAFLGELEREYGITILYACESGSRAWGFASSDSDYDIRFIYQSNDAVTHSVQGKELETIEIPIEDDLDAGGWSVKKALSLLKKSNGALIEWLHSPIVYKAVNGFLDEWRSTTRAILSEKNLVGHYKGHAYQIWNKRMQGEQVTGKAYLYVLRTLLCADWIITKRENPPVPFPELLRLTEPRMREAIDHLMVLKASIDEKGLVDRYGVIDAYIEKSLNTDAPADLSERQEYLEEIETLYKRWSVRGYRLGSVKELTLSRAKRSDLLLFRAIAGSQAYGTAHAESDIDHRGVFALPRHLLGSLEHIDQVQDERGDDVLYELGKVVGMLQKSNPNMLELLYLPDDCVLYQHPVWSLLKPEDYLSKQCEQSFANYAVAQVKKARGLNKKIVNPEPEQRKDLVNFCYVVQGQGAQPLSEWCEQNAFDLRTIGLVNTAHAPNVYSIYTDKTYRGAFSRKGDNEIICSSVEIDAVPQAWMVCNVDAYKQHCKSHREYWAWVSNRNESRYTSSNSAGYDTKNMMHTLRLLDVAEEIAREGLIRVRRPNADFLMEVRLGKYTYEYLLKLAEEKILSVHEAYLNTSLPNYPSFEKANATLMEMREVFG